MLLGSLPALVVLLCYLAGWAWLASQSLGIAEWLTGFAADWSAIWRDALRYVVAGALVLGVAVLGVLSYTAVTIVLGAPAYEAISSAVEKEYGGISSPVERSVAAQFRAAFLDGLRLVGRAIGLAILVGLIGLIPGIGTIAGWVIGAVLGGHLIVLELVGPACDARGFSLQQRSSLLRRSRARSLGFGTVIYLLFLVPLGAVLVMPAAMAGATALARELNGEPTRK